MNHRLIQRMVLIGAACLAFTLRLRTSARADDRL